MYNEYKIMKNDYLQLKEKAVHGTPEKPIQYLYFDSRNDPLVSLNDSFFVARHWHPECEILYVEKGELYLEHNFDTILLRENDICLIDAEELHQLQGVSPDTIHHAIIFDPKLFQASLADAFDTDIIAPYLQKKIGFPLLIKEDRLGYSLIHDLILNMIRVMHKNTPYAYYEVKLALYTLFLNFYELNLFVEKESRQLGEEYESIEKYKSMILYIEEHYQEEIRLSDLSNLISSNQSYVNMLFKRLHHDSPIHYLIQYRIEKAAQLLKETDRSVLDVGLECGFQNVSYFIRQFKEAKGMTPLKYRKNSRLS